MIVETRRRWRLLCTALLLISLASASALWSVYSSREEAIIVVCLAALAMLMVLAIEILATAAEKELEVLILVAKKCTADDVVSDSEIRRLMGVIDILTTDNNLFRHSAAKKLLH